MNIRWSARPIGASTLCLGGSTEYLVTGEIGEPGLDGFWAHSVPMTQEMLEDDWLPDVCARIERLARLAFPPPPLMFIFPADISPEDVKRFEKEWNRSFVCLPPQGVPIIVR